MSLRISEKGDLALFSSGKVLIVKQMILRFRSSARLRKCLKRCAGLLKQNISDIKAIFTLIPLTFWGKD